LWALSGHPEIPILKTKLLISAGGKHDFLHHFHKPRLDLLLLNNTGRYRELPSWRKAFKREWKKLAKTPIEMPIKPKYQPDIVRWVCICPYFVTSRFLVCKHLV